jgi:hypothetical protein
MSSDGGIAKSANNQKKMPCPKISIERLRYTALTHCTLQEGLTNILVKELGTVLWEYLYVPTM